MHNAIARHGRTCERNGTHIAMRTQRLASFFAVAMNHIQHTRRHAGLKGQLTQSGCGQRRQLAHLQHSRVAKCQTRRHFPRGCHEWHVPRGNQGAHAHGVEQGVVQMRWRWVGVAIHTRAHFSEVVKVIGSAWHQLFACLADGLACVFGFGLCDLGHVLGNQVTQIAYDFCALSRGACSPRWKCIFGCLHGSIDFHGGAAGDFSQDFLCCWIHRLKVLVGADGFAVDQVFDTHMLLLHPKN